MTQKLVIAFSVLWLGMATNRQAAEFNHNSCSDELPSAARMLLATRFEAWKIVTIGDLGTDEQRVWHKKFGNRCPGVATGHFEATSHTSYGVTLIRRHENNEVDQTLLLLSKSGTTYRIVTLSPAQRSAVTSVVLRLPPGQYSRSDRSKKVDVKFDVISYEAIEAGAIAYYWDGRSYKSLQTSE